MEKHPELLEHLHASTWHRHAGFEKLPFVRAMTDGALPLISYIGQLRGLAIVFGALERALAASADPAITRVRPILRSRFSMLCADLDHFAPSMIPDLLPAVQLALRFAASIRIASPRWLLGVLYVLEGTTKGNQVHLPDIRRCFKLETVAGATFYQGYGEQTEKHWNEFREAMNRDTTSDAMAEALQGVTSAYDALEKFHQALYPVAEGTTAFTATTLNPEAGEHPVPQNLEILNAVLRAGRRCRDEFSYYQHRYGDRGKRFTDSDAAWLGTLIELPLSVMKEQVLWLSRVLSTRGMPTLLLVRQLDILLEELASLNPPPPLATLRELIDDLGCKRHQPLEDKNFERLVMELRASVNASTTSPERLRGFPDLPLIIAGAHIDRLNGLPECSASLASWLIESGLLSAADIGAIQQICSRECAAL